MTNYWLMKSEPHVYSYDDLIKDGSRIASTTSVTPKLLVYKGEVINAAEIGDIFDCI